MQLKHSAGQGDKSIMQPSVLDIINGMYDWVRVIDRDDNIIFVNKAMSESLANCDSGHKCYNALGRSIPCKNCTSRKTLFDGKSYEKEEIINGQIFSVMSSPIKNDDGEIIAVVEVLRNITPMKLMQKEIISQNKKLQDDLKIAKKLQCSLLPRGIPDSKLNFSFVYRPCESLGGDFVDIFQIDDSHTGIYIADVSGHGVPASMMTVFLRSSIDKNLLSPSEALEKLFKEFNSNNFEPDLYITVFYAIVDTVEKTITYSNAGHNVSPVLFNDERFELLRVPGIPISNWLEEPVYADMQKTLKKGDKIFLYTDGIIEIRNAEKEQFGEERLLEILLKDKSAPSSVLNRIVDCACEFAGIKDSDLIIDDITLALIEIK